jgi:hypothetical protein
MFAAALYSPQNFVLKYTFLSWLWSLKNYISGCERSLEHSVDFELLSFWTLEQLFTTFRKFDLFPKRRVLYNMEQKHNIPLIPSVMQYSQNLQDLSVQTCRSTVTTISDRCRAQSWVSFIHFIITNHSLINHSNVVFPKSPYLPTGLFQRGYSSPPPPKLWSIPSLAYPNRTPSPCLYRGFHYPNNTMRFLQIVDFFVMQYSA